MPEWASWQETLDTKGVILVSTMHAPHVGLRRPHINPWLVAVVALAAALVALGAWVLVDQTSSSTSKPAATSGQGLASPGVVTMLRDRITAFNSGDAKAVSAFYTRNGVLEERDVTPAVVSRGSAAIGDRINQLVTWYGMRLESASPVIQLGSTAAEAVRVPGDTTTGWVLVYQLAANGKIAHQWVLPTGRG